MQVPRFQACFGVLAGLLLFGCATRPNTPPQRTWAKPSNETIEGVKNFGKVTPRIWRGAQPSKEGFRNLERAGAKTVVNLRLFHSDRSRLRGTDLEYARIRMKAINPKQRELEQLITSVKLLDTLSRDPNRSPVFIHCTRGEDRVGFASALYRMVYQNWSAEDAIHEMFDYGLNRWFFAVPSFFRSLDIQEVRERLQRTEVRPPNSNAISVDG